MEEKPDDLSSGSNSVNPNVCGSTNALKTGRKGDPRMHRAVAARLSNPKISLFDALKVGGFDYPNDEDVNHVDAEKITLGQRKNQLSRRIRLAKRQNEEKSHDQTNPFSATGLGNEAKTGGLVAGIKRPHSHSFAEDRCFDDDLASETNKLRTEDSEALLVVARNHPDYRPLVIPRVGQIAGSHNVDGFIAMNQAYQQMGGVSNFAPSNIPQQPVVGVTFNNGPGHQPLTAMLPNTLDSTAPRGNRGNESEQASSAGPNPFNAAASPAFNFGNIPADQRQDAAATQPLHNSASNATSAEASLGSAHSHARHSTPPSGVAIASLAQTAASVGMSLEQLAVVLRTGNTLAKCLHNCAATPQSQKDLAVALYQSENRSLCARSMLMVGYPAKDANDETSQQHLEVAWEAWSREGQRLQGVLNQRLEAEPPLEANAPRADPGSGPGGVGAGGSAARGSGSNQGSRSFEGGNSHFGLGHSHPHLQHGSQTGGAEGGNSQFGLGHNHPHRHQHQNESGSPTGAGDGGSKCCEGGNSQFGPAVASKSGGRGGCVYSKGRHIHRLEGHCGHKAILHQPPNGSVHIDFVVGDRIECYEGVQPISYGQSSVKIWPSNFKCKQLLCEDSCSDKDLTETAKEHKHGTPDCVVFGDPKILDLSKIDLDTNEWNADFANGESVLGLFKLGDSNETSKPASIEANAAPMAANTEGQNSEQ